MVDGATTVALVVFGTATQQVKAFWWHYNSKKSDFKFFDAIDIRSVLTADPSVAKRFRAPHEHNGDFLDTMANMLNDPRFVDAVGR